MDRIIRAGYSLYLIGLLGTHADNPAAAIRVTATGHTTGPGVGVVYFPMKDGGDQDPSPVNLEMHTTGDLESLPYGQWPEVPWAAGLPLVATLPLGLTLVRCTRGVV